MCAIPLFSTLGATEHAELARLSADIRLTPGECAVHEGEAPAFFVVLEGKLEIIKIVDGMTPDGPQLPGVWSGIFSAGDVRFSPVKRVASAVGEGSMAIAFVHQFIASIARK